MSLTSSLQRIVSAKESIRQAIESKGVTVASSVGIADYPSYIGAITGGGASCVLLSKVITANGVYSAVDDNADGYSEVTVSVPTGGGGGVFDIDGWANFTMSEIDDTNGQIKGIGFLASTYKGFYPYCSWQSMLISINLPSCSRIGNYGFANCSSLSYVSIPNCQTIGERVFYSCTSLSMPITLDVCTSIGTYAFYDTNVSSIVAPNCSYLGMGVVNKRANNYISVSEICNINSSCGAYSNRSTVGTNIYCDYLSINGISRYAVYSIRWNSANFYVSTSCKVICQQMSAYGTGNVRYMDLKNVVAIGSYAFASNAAGYSLQSVLSISGSQVEWCGAYTFNLSSRQGMYSLQTIDFPKLSILPDYFAWGGSVYFQSLITSAIVSFGNSALYYANLSSVNISPNCSYIGAYGLGYCKLKNPIRLDHLSYLGSQGFIYTNIPNANISTISTLYSSIFAYCSYLSYAKFKDVDLIYPYVFNQCSKIARCYFLSSSVATLSNANAFYNSPISNSTYLGDFGSIYVPYSLLNGYKTATNWATYSNRFTGLYEFTIGGIKYWGGVGSTYTQWVDDAIDNEDGFVVNGTSLFTSDGTKYVVGMDLTSAIEDGATFTLADV